MIAHADLDFTVLGVIGRRGPLTAYAVRKEFRNSAAPAWSSSAGSIYPAIRRLQAAGLVSAGVATDRRGSQKLSITADGRTAVHQWLMAIDPQLGGPTPDPIRTRAQFLDTLSTAEQLTFFDRCIDATKAGLTLIENRISNVEQASVGEHLGAAGAKAELEARLSWLERSKSAAQL